MSVTKIECPQCLGTKKHLRSAGRRRRKMSECTLCDENGLLENTIAEDFITTKLDVYGDDYDRPCD